MYSHWALTSALFFSLYGNLGPSKPKKPKKKKKKEPGFSAKIQTRAVWLAPESRLCSPMCHNSEWGQRSTHVLGLHPLVVQRFKGPQMSRSVGSSTSRAPDDEASEMLKTELFCHQQCRGHVFPAGRTMRRERLRPGLWDTCLFEEACANLFPLQNHFISSGGCFVSTAVLLLQNCSHLRVTHGQPALWAISRTFLTLAGMAFLGQTLGSCLLFPLPSREHELIFIFTAPQWFSKAEAKLMSAPSQFSVSQFLLLLHAHSWEELMDSYATVLYFL